MASVRVDSIRVGDRVRQDFGDVVELATSISEVGLLHPVVVDGDLRLIAGARRLEAVRLLGWSTVPVTVARSVDDEDKALQAEQEENTCRKEFTPLEAHAMWEARKARMAVEAKERQGTRTDLQHSVLGSECPKPRPHGGETAHRAAEGTGLSAASLKRVDKVVKAVDDPDPAVAETARHVIQQMESGEIGPSAAAAAVDEARGPKSPSEAPLPVRNERRPRLPKTDYAKAFDRSMHALMGLVQGLEQLPADFTPDAEKAAAADGDLTRAIRALTALRKQIKENQ